MSFQIIKAHTVKIIALRIFYIIQPARRYQGYEGTSYLRVQRSRIRSKSGTAVWPKPQYPPTWLQSIKTQMPQS